ncbi:MAG TPA: HD domain-containing protein [Chloroflexota bacterium]|nr:HD domain-containing protein [Chloroflexota bacterium]
MAFTISELSPATPLDAGFYAVQEIRQLKKKDGAPFLRARLRDATGQVEAVVWDNLEEAGLALVVGKVVKVRGQVARAFKGDGVEITIERIRLARDDEYSAEALLPRSEHPEAELIQSLRTLVESLRPEVKGIVWAALEPELGRFASWPGATDLHHAWVGGLLEHTLEVANLSEAIIRTIPGPDRDLTVAGALLHDVGKLDAYDVTTTFLATDSGRLVGHVLTGYHRVQVACDQAHAPNDLTLRLLHIIASHHGQIEFGAAREPAIAEAIVIHYADELSAQLMQVRGAQSRSSDGSRWNNRVPGLKRDVFLGDRSPEP